MKKLLFLLFIALFAFSWQVDAQFTEDFEGATFPPAGWVKELGDAANDITQSNSQNHTSGGTYSARFSSYSNASDYNQYLFTASITVQAGVNDQISFWHRKYNSSSETLEWGVSTTTQTSGAVSSWTAVTLNTTWEQTTVDLSAYNGQTIYFAWHYYGNYLYYVYLDDVVSEALPSCPDPSSQSESNITSSSADLDWVQVGSPTTWEIEWGPTGFTQGTGTTITGITSHPYTLSGLNSVTDYDWYVRADCGGGSYSAWTGPHTFNTIGPGYTCGDPLVVSSLPYSTSDNTGNYGDDYSSTDEICSNSSYLNGDDVVYSYTPSADECIDITLTNTGTYVGLFVYEGCSPFTTCVASDKQSGGNPSLSGVSLTSGHTYYIIISTWPSPQSTAYDMTIDNCPACVDPTNQSESNITSTSADLDWVENSGNTSWEIEWGVTGFTQGNGTVITTSTKPYTLSGLTASTTYDWYVRSDCGGGTYTNWVGPSTFTTLGTPPANDDCDGAYSVTVNNDLSCGSTTSGTVENATQSQEDASACSGTEDDDVWFSFVATATEHKIELLNIAGSTTDLYHSVWEGTCPGGLTLVSGTCSDPNSQTVSGLTIGNTYFIRVYTWTATGGQNTTFDVCVGTPPPIPPNDDCSGAIALTVGNPGDCPTNQVTTDATSATDDGSTSCDGSGNIGVWYSFVAPTSGEVVVNYTAGTATGNPGIVLFDACGGNEIPNTCQNNPATLSNITGLTGSTTYYMLLWFDSGAGSFDICLEDVGSCPKPSGQSESNITSTSSDLDWVDNASATTWDIEWGATGFTQGNGTMITGTTTKPYALSGLTANTTYDWYVRADCGASGGTGTSPWEGPHTFTTLPPPPANDECTGAISVTVDAAGTGCTSPTTADNTSATGSEATNGTPSCNDYQGGDVWYSFTAPYGGKVKVILSVNNWSTAAAAIYDDCGSSTEIDCNGKFGTGDFTLEGMTAGNTYYLRMWDYGNNDKGTVDFCLEELPCNIPTGLSASNETTSGADLAWTENGAADHWDLFIVETSVGTVPDASTTPTVDNTTDNPYTWAGGNPATDYDWYVRADCGASGGSGQSDWSAKGTFTTASADAVDWCNLQYPDQATITAGGSVDVFAQVYEPGVTEAAGQGAGITAWIGYSTTDTDPSTWTDWVAATYNTDSGNNDEYKAALGSGLTPGTYYYASRFKLNAGAYKYGGYSSGGGGFWDGTTYVSGVLTVNAVTGDLLCDAIALTVDAAPATYSNSNCYGETNEPNGSCWNGTTSMESIWFSFVAPSTGHVEVTTDFDTPLDDTHIAIYEVGDCNDMTTLTENGCDEDGGDAGTNGWNSVADVDGLTSGNTYYVQVDGYTTKDGEFQIQVKTLCPTNLVVLPASSAAVTSNASCQDGDWTNYYNGTNILLSLNIGTSGAVIPVSGVTVDPDGATDAFWGANDGDGFPSVNGATGAGFMRRKWNVSPTTQPSSDVGVRFYYTQAEFDAVNGEITGHGGTAMTNKNQINFYKVLTSEDPFNVSPGGIAAGDYTLVLHGSTPGTEEWVDGTYGSEYYAEYNVTGFSGGGGGGASANALIPIELKEFKGYAEKSSNVLEWITLSEANTAKFVIERSVDGDDWKAVASVKAAGSSRGVLNYKAMDNDPVSSAYYRLRTYDLDGRFMLSSVILITRRSSELKISSVYPNPNKGQFIVSLTKERNKTLSFKLVNTLGISVYTNTINDNKDRMQEAIDVSNLPNGVYMLITKQSNNSIIKRIVISK